MFTVIAVVNGHPPKTLAAFASPGDAEQWMNRRAADGSYGDGVTFIVIDGEVRTFATAKRETA